MAGRAKILLHIGYGKAGSSSLQTWFARHPDIISFAARGIYEATRDPTDRSDKVFVLSDERLGLGIGFDAATGLFTNTNNVAQVRSETADMLRSIFPEAHVLIVTRGYEGFLRSFYSQYLRKCGILDWEEFLIQYRDAIKEILDVDKLIDLYARRYGPEKVIVLPFELLVSDRAKFGSRIEELLGLSSERMKIPHLNPALTISEARMYPQLNLFARRAVAGLPEKWQPKLLKIYQRRIVSAKFTKLLIRLLSRDTAPQPFPSGYLSEIAGRQNFLRDRADYAPFFPDYLVCEAGPTGRE